MNDAELVLKQGDLYNNVGNKTFQGNFSFLRLTNVQERSPTDLGCIGLGSGQEEREMYKSKIVRSKGSQNFFVKIFMTIKNLLV